MDRNESSSANDDDDDILKAREEEERKWFVKELEWCPWLILFDRTKAVDFSNSVENLAAVNKNKGRDITLIMQT